MSSWWDKYLAPGDLRAQQRQQAQPFQDASTTLKETPLLSSSSSSSSSETNNPSPNPRRITAPQRAFRQNGLFYGGLGFTILSLIITRRSLRRKHLSVAHLPSPEVYAAQAAESSTSTSTSASTLASETAAAFEGSRSLDAAEALFLATLNVASVFMLAAGTFMKVCDVADEEDMREFVRRGLGYDVYAGERNEEADRELEAWVAGVLKREDGKEGLDLSQGKLMSVVAGLEGLEKGKDGKVEVGRIQELVEEKKKKEKKERKAEEVGNGVVVDEDTGK